LRNEIEIVFKIRNENRPDQNRVGDGLGNFRFAAAGDRAGFVAEGAEGRTPTRRQRRFAAGFSIFTR